MTPRAVISTATFSFLAHPIHRNEQVSLINFLNSIGVVVVSQGVQPFFKLDRYEAFVLFVIHQQIKKQALSNVNIVMDLLELKTHFTFDINEALRNLTRCGIMQVGENNKILLKAYCPVAVNAILSLSLNQPLTSNNHVVKRKSHDITEEKSEEHKALELENQCLKDELAKKQKLIEEQKTDNDNLFGAANLLVGLLTQVIKMLPPPPVKAQIPSNGTSFTLLKPKPVVLPSISREQGSPQLFSSITVTTTATQLTQGVSQQVVMRNTLFN